MTPLEEQVIRLGRLLALYQFTCQEGTVADTLLESAIDIRDAADRLVDLIRDVPPETFVHADVRLGEAVAMLLAAHLNATEVPDFLPEDW